MDLKLKQVWRKEYQFKELKGIAKAARAEKH